MDDQPPGVAAGQCDDGSFKSDGHAVITAVVARLPVHVCQQFGKRDAVGFANRVRRALLDAGAPDDTRQDERVEVGFGETNGFDALIGGQAADGRAFDAHDISTVGSNQGARLVPGGDDASDDAVPPETGQDFGLSRPELGQRRRRKDVGGRF